MKFISVGASLTWQIAARAAVSGRHRFIEKEHLFLGIVSLGKMICRMDKQAGMSEHSALALEEEYKVLCDLFLPYQVDPDRLRSILVGYMTRGDYTHDDTVVHRSDECKIIFSRAEQISTVSGCNYLSSLHLLAAIVKDPGDVISEVLADTHIVPHLLLTRVVKFAAESGLYASKLNANEFKTVHMFAQSKKTPRVTFVFEQVDGIDTLLRTHGDARCRELLSQHEKVVRDLVTSKSGEGHVVKVTGDGVLMAFLTPEAALDTSLRIQTAVRADGKLSVRIGLDTVVLKKPAGKESGRAGLPIRTAFNIMRMSQGGHILASKSFRQALDSSQFEHVEWCQHGTVVLEAGEPALAVYEVYDGRITTPLPVPSGPVNVEEIYDEIKKIWARAGKT